MTKRRRILLIGLAIATGLVAWIWIYDTWRHNDLRKDFNDTIQVLRSSSEAYESISGCRYSVYKDTTIGRGEKSCKLEARALYTANSVEEAAAISRSVIRQISGFHFDKAIDLKQYPNPDMAGGLDRTVHGSTKSPCYIRMTYRAQSAQLEVLFSCDDTSWFARTFQRNNSIFSY